MPGMNIVKISVRRWGLIARYNKGRCMDKDKKFIF